MKDIKYWLWISRIENLQPIQKLKLIQKFKDPQILWDMSKEELIENGIKENQAEKLVNIVYKSNLEKYEEYMYNNNIEIITIYDEEYPTNLKKIYDAPIALYIKGNRKILNNYGLAMVGCRECTHYGEEVAKKLAYNLGKSNINVISGLARGIDSYSHIGCIAAKGKTIAIVGCGLDRVYPLENKYLFDKIIEENGTILSEYIIGTKPIPKNFPARNRIISAISNGVIVVEAKKQSGTLITVDFALEQGKEVYVIPGNITSKNSYGTNELIKNGARIIIDINDIFK